MKLKNTAAYDEARTGTKVRALPQQDGLKGYFIKQSDGQWLASDGGSTLYECEKELARKVVKPVAKLMAAFMVEDQLELHELVARYVRDISGAFTVRFDEHKGLWRARVYG